MTDNRAALTRAHVINGSFGSGKTTAIRWLMARKPEDELWVRMKGVFRTGAGPSWLVQAHGRGLSGEDSDAANPVNRGPGTNR